MELVTFVRYREMKNPVFERGKEWILLIGFELVGGIECLKIISLG